MTSGGRKDDDTDHRLAGLSPHRVSVVERGSDGRTDPAIETLVTPA